MKYLLLKDFTFRRKHLWEQPHKARKYRRTFRRYFAKRMRVTQKRLCLEDY